MIAKLQALRRDAATIFPEGGHIIVLEMPENNGYRAYVGRSMSKAQAVACLKAAIISLEEE